MRRLPDKIPILMQVIVEWFICSLVRGCESLESRTICLLSQEDKCVSTDYLSTVQPRLTRLGVEPSMPRRVGDTSGSATRRADEIHRLWLQGKPTSEIASQLQLSARTVRYHVARLKAQMRQEVTVRREYTLGRSYAEKQELWRHLWKILTRVPEIKVNEAVQISRVLLDISKSKDRITGLDRPELAAQLAPGIRDNVILSYLNSLPSELKNAILAYETRRNPPDFNLYSTGK